MDILSSILESLNRHPRIMLATIISTSGSTPASAFSRMVVADEGKRSIGTVGGGCMEGDVLHEAKRLYQENKAAVMTFHLNEDDMIHGLICGGSLDVLIEPVVREEKTLFEAMQSVRNRGDDSILGTLLGPDGTLRQKVLLERTPSGETVGWNELRRFAADDRAITFPPSATPQLSAVLHRQQTARIASPDGEWIFEPVTGRPHLIVFGGGHVSKYISSAAAMSGFRVTVVDDRPQYANPGRFPEADETRVLEFYEAFSHLHISSSTYIVIVTRGHRSDEEILVEAVKTPARYIGMIGSRRKVLKTYENLLSAGASVEQLQRVHAPMGLDIGAVTAEEIGISIVAELIQIRRGVPPPIKPMAEGMADLIKQLGR